MKEIEKRGKKKFVKQSKKQLSGCAINKMQWKHAFEDFFLTLTWLKKE